MQRSRMLRPGLVQAAPTLNLRVREPRVTDPLPSELNLPGAKHSRSRRGGALSPVDRIAELSYPHPQHFDVHIDTLEQRA